MKECPHGAKAWWCVHNTFMAGKLMCNHQRSENMNSYWAGELPEQCRGFEERILKRKKHTGE